ncbi:MAG: Na+/H+ antiporter subunit E [Spirochaetes bacterium]|nr:Na+/H+ antiporter subunit E [Spirochaetota bacterium]
MEVTLLIEAMDSSFKIMEKAKSDSVGLLETAVRLTSRTRSIEEKKINEILKGAKSRKGKVQNIAVSFLLLFVFWLLLSGKFDLFHMTLGFICSLLISFLTYDLLFANVRVGDIRLTIFRFLRYIPWLMYQIITSNFYVAKLVLKPGMYIDPHIVKFRTKLESDISWVALANSITLTPGTITMNIHDGEFFIHALDRKVADDLKSGEMEDRIAHIFMEADHIYIQDVLDVAAIFSELRKNL